MRSGIRQECPPSLLVFSTVLKILTTARDQVEKTTKSLRTRKEEINRSIFPDDRIALYIKYKGI